MDYLFDKWGNVEEKLKDRHLFIFLDFDGTLTPIVQTPHQAVLPEAMRELLKELSYIPDIKLAFISGRSLEDIKSKIRLPGAIYSGNHGLEIRGPQINFRSAVAAEYKKTLKQIRRELREKIAPVRGAFVEDKGLSLALHYRLVNKKQVHLVKTIFHETVIHYTVKNKIKIKTGKEVFEVRPPLEWDKGKVVLWLLARQIFTSDKGRTLPIYLGDDTTDEDAFKTLKNKGLTVYVGRSRESQAEYYLKNSHEVAQFLRKIREIKCRT